MSRNLRNFSKDEIIIDNEDAYALLKFFFLVPGIPLNAITFDDINFSQGLFLEAIDGSYKIGLIKIIFDTFYMKIPLDFNNLGGMVKDFIKNAAISWWKHATQEDLKNPQIYEIVRSQLQSNFNSVWRTRIQTGDILY